MNKCVSKCAISLCTSAWISMASMVPVWADSQTNTTAPKKATSSSGSTLAMIPGFCLGFVVGTPICFVRKLKHEAIEGAHGLVGSIVTDNNNPWLLVPAGLCWLPAAGLTAAVETPVYAWRNAWMADEPFSKEQFSLGDMENDGKDKVTDAAK